MRDTLSLGLSIAGTVAVLVIVKRDEHGNYSVVDSDRLPFDRNEAPSLLQSVIFHNVRFICQKYDIEYLGVMFRRSPAMRIERLRGVLELIPYQEDVVDYLLITEYTRKEVQKIISGKEESDRYDNLKILEKMFPDDEEIDVHLNINLNALMSAVAILEGENGETNIE